MSASSELIEIFSAIQGEGTIVGRRQIFVRFSRCDVKCEYCDTPLCHVELARCRVEVAAGRREFESHPNPVSPSSILAWIERLATPSGRHHSVSYTGGEPLLHPAMILALGESVRDMGLLRYLETNGHLVEALRSVLPAIDIVGMDIKLPSTTGFAARFDENEAFLRTALGANKETFVKIVVGERTEDPELRSAIDVVARVDSSVPVILQPVTPFAGRGVPPTPERLIAMHDLGLDLLPDVRVIPQTHKMIHQL